MFEYATRRNAIRKISNHMLQQFGFPVYTENPIRVDDVMESPTLANWSSQEAFGECTMSALGTSIPDDACPIDSLGPSLLERCDRCITGVKEDALLRAFGFVVLADLDGRR